MCDVLIGEVLTRSTPEGSADYWFWNQQEAAVNHVTLHVHGFIYKPAVRIEIMVAAVGVMDWFYL